MLNIKMGHNLVDY